MILGILSDTHGRTELTAAALELLRHAGAEEFIHCGDLGGEAILDQLAGVPAHFVWGNTDDSGASLTRYAKTLGLPVPGRPPLRLKLGGKSIAAFHGHEPEFARLAQLADSIDLGPFRRLAAADYVLFGHRHVPYDRQCGTVRVINPGAIHRVQVPTVATLDLAQDLLRFWVVDPERRGEELPREWHA